MLAYKVLRKAILLKQHIIQVSLQMVAPENTNRKKQDFRTYLLYMIVVVLISANAGCGDRGPEKEDAYLVRIGEHVLTLSDYNSALEIAKTAYPHNEIQGSDVASAIMLRLLNQMIEEMVIMVKASELGITVSDEEMSAAIAKIKEDYPDDEFEKTFLENAISFESWKKRLKTRLLIEKMVKEELQDKITINPDDISNYYKANQKGNGSEPDIPGDLSDIDEAIIENIRRKKAEVMYKDWLERLQKEYTVDINTKMWNKMIGSE